MFFAEVFGSQTGLGRCQQCMHAIFLHKFWRVVCSAGGHYSTYEYDKQIA